MCGEHYPIICTWQPRAEGALYGSQTRPLTKTYKQSLSCILFFLYSWVPGYMYRPHYRLFCWIFPQFLQPDVGKVSQISHESNCYILNSLLKTTLPFNANSRSAVSTVTWTTKKVYHTLNSFLSKWLLKTRLQPTLRVSFHISIQSFGQEKTALCRTISLMLF
jgi:hypothetical protein